MTHQGFRTGTGSESHFDAARSIGRGQKRLGPGRVIPVSKGRLCPIYRQCLGISRESQPGQFQAESFFNGALSERCSLPVWEPIKIAIALNGA